MTLSGNNTFTGPLTVTTGTVSVPTVNDAGAPAGPLGSGASVVLGSSTTDGTLRLTGTAVTYSSTKKLHDSPRRQPAPATAYIQVDNPNDQPDPQRHDQRRRWRPVQDRAPANLTFTGPLKVGTGTTYLGP